MGDSKTQIRGLVEKYRANCDRIEEIATACEEQKRERTQTETAEYEALVRENQLLSMKLQAATAEHLRENASDKDAAVKMIRENAANGRKTEIILTREAMVVSDVRTGGVVPLSMQDIIKPLQEGFILDKVGLPMPTGLVGDFVWPIYEIVEATVLGETAELADTKIPFSKLTANPARIGVAVPVSNQSLNQTDGLLEMIVQETLPLAVRTLLNRIVCGVKAVNSTAESAGLIGPFATEGVKGRVVDLSSTPTFTELNTHMKAAMLETGVDGEHACWVMSKSMAAILEGTPINPEGVHVPMLQNGILCGLPVYTTSEVCGKDIKYKKYSGSAWQDYQKQPADKVAVKVFGTTEQKALAKATSPKSGDIAAVTVRQEYIGLGDWRYQPMGMFGAMRFIVDPYSQARKDCVDFVLNADYGTKTLREEAFILGKVADA